MTSQPVSVTVTVDLVGAPKHPDDGPGRWYNARLVDSEGKVIEAQGETPAAASAMAWIAYNSRPAPAWTSYSWLTHSKAQVTQPRWSEPDGQPVEPGDHPHYAIWDHVNADWDLLPTGAVAPAAPSAEPFYLPMDCPVCGRRRMQWNGKVLSCEKCRGSSERDEFTRDRYFVNRAEQVDLHVPVVEVYTPQPDKTGHVPAVLCRIEVDGRLWPVTRYAVENETRGSQLVTLTFAAGVTITHPD